MLSKSLSITLDELCSLSWGGETALLVESARFEEPAIRLASGNRRTYVAAVWADVVVRNGRYQ